MQAPQQQRKARRRVRDDPRSGVGTRPAKSVTMSATQWVKVRGLLGLGLRARSVVVGVEQVKAAVGKRSVRLTLVADDAAENSRTKVLPLLAARHVLVIGGVTAGDLGAAVGRETTTVVAVVDEALARGIRGALAPMSP